MIYNKKYLDYKSTLIDGVLGTQVKVEDTPGFILDGDNIVKMDNNSDSILNKMVHNEKKDMSIKDYKLFLR